jgi:hypothetical protein
MSNIKMGRELPQAGRVKITVTIDEQVARLLEVLASSDFAALHVGGKQSSRDHKLASVLYTLIDHAQQGVYRPGAWEREWICQAFGDDWQDQLEPGDPFGRANCDSIFQKPKERES